MKEQICLTIFILNIFCLIVILSICCSFSYEILKEDYKAKKLYFYNKYKDYIESCFYFQNFCLLQYEEIIKRIQKQSYEYNRIFNFFPSTNFDNYEDKVNFYDDLSHKNITNNEKNPKLYFVCYWEPYDSSNEFAPIPHDVFCQGMKNIILNNYQTMLASFIFHDSKTHFSIPWYNSSIINSPLIVNVNYSSIFSFDASKIHQKLIEIQGDSTIVNHNKLRKYFLSKVDYIASRIYDNNLFIYFSQKSEFFENMFYKINNQIKNKLKGTFLNDLSLLYEYLSKIHYENNTYSILNQGSDFNLFYCETNIIDNFLFFLMSKITNFLGIYFIPISFDTDKILSLELCNLFMQAQSAFQIDNNKLEELINELKRNNLTFEYCFIYKNLINSQLDIKEIINLNFTTFLSINNLIYQGLLYLNNDEDTIPFYFMKYSYPNYNILNDFHTEYLILDQINFYLYIPFKDPIKFSQYSLQISENIFFMIIMIIEFIWVFCLFINLIIYYGVINKWINPFIKLQEAIKTSSLKDENIFIYKNDDIINELFGTCKELLIGGNDNKENRINNFNILSKDKRKKIDTQIYKKNLIINNNIMNKLINEQRNMMDFSNNIKLNERYINKDNQKNKKEHYKKSLYLKGHFEGNLMSTLDNTKDTKSKSLNKDNNNDEEKENEPYKNLFKIAEYLYYYRNKTESENIFIIDNNSIINENKMSKNLSKNSKNVHSSLKYFKRSVSKNDLGPTKENNEKRSVSKNDLGPTKENNEKINVNMLDEDNICYLWYMEVKKRNNKTFNYKISDDYNELFTDYKNN